MSQKVIIVNNIVCVFVNKMMIALSYRTRDRKEEEEEEHDKIVDDMDWEQDLVKLLPYLGMVGRFCSDDPCFGEVLCPFKIWLTCSLCRKNQFVSITFSSRDTWN